VSTERIPLFLFCCSQRPPRSTCLLYFAAITLGGLVLNALLGWWWADPIAALVMVPIIVKEGIEGLRGETCCDDGCGPAGS